MSKRANYIALAPEALQILFSQEAYLTAQFSASATLSMTLWELIKLRVSQLNQCAFCVDMHSKEALEQGETLQRIIGLSAWRDMPLYSDSEKVALDWAEHLTSAEPIDEGRYQRAVQIFGERALIDLTVAVNAINSWNRIAKTFKPEVGCYKPK